MKARQLPRASRARKRAQGRVGRHQGLQKALLLFTLVPLQRRQNRRNSAVGDSPGAGRA